MRRIVVAVMGTLSGLVLLFSYHTSTNSEATALRGAAGGSGSTGGSGSSGATSSGGTSSTATASAAGGSSSSGTYTGDAVETRWGTVQVRITVVAGKITKAEAVQYPQDNPRDQEINAFAVPQLNAEVVQHQSGTIDAVSGATVTSGGYVQSLQSALDQAHL